MWRQGFVILVLHLTGSVAENTVSVSNRVVGEKGENVILPCKYTPENQYLPYSLIWKDQDSGDSLYVYKKGEFDHAANIHVGRYTRYNLHLVISSFRESDSGTKCCEITTDSQTIAACTELIYIDNTESLLECRDQYDLPVENFVTIRVREPRLRVTCEYSSMYAGGELMLSQDGVKEPLRTVLANQSTESNGRFFLNIVIDRDVDVPETYIIHSKQASVIRRVIIRLQPAWSQANKLVCYVPASANQRFDPYTFNAGNVPSEHCTHIVWGHAAIDDNTVLASPTVGEIAQLRSLVSMKENRPDLKILASVGGRDSSQMFSKVVKNEVDMEMFAASCLMYIKDMNIDGIAIDWEFPTNRQREQFSQLLQAIRTKLDTEAKSFYLLSVSLGVEQNRRDSYNLPEISKVADIVNLMTYDLHEGWEETGLQAGIRPQTLFTAASLTSVVDYFLELGLDPSKATLGIPLFGRSFLLCDDNDSTLGARACGYGEPGTTSNTPGILFYYEICLKMAAAGWSITFDPIGQAPYMSKGLQWVSFESTRSVSEKARFLLRKGMSGAMVMDVSQDDFGGHCKQETPFPLVASIADELNTTVKLVNQSSKQPSSPDSAVLVCFFNSMARLREIPYGFHPTDVPSEYCTHIIWAYITIGNRHPWKASKVEREQLLELLSLKMRRPSIKILASLGGEKASGEFSKVVESQAHIELFTEACLKYVLDNELDGLDLSWQYPKPSQRRAFIILIKSLRHKLNSLGRVNYLLTVTLGSRNETIEDSIDMNDVTLYADIINVIAFDYHAPGGSKTGFPSSLFHDQSSVPQYSAGYAMNRYKEQGMPVAMATMGIPFHGYSFELCESSNDGPNGFGAPTCAVGEMGSVSQQPGVLFYNEICEMKFERGWKNKHDVKRHATYSYRGKEWISYEDQISVQVKVDYAKKHGYAGVMVMDITQDDFLDNCGEGKFPLLRTIVGDLNTILIPGAAGGSQSLVTMCFFPVWGKQKEFQVSSVNPTYCSHIIWSFVTVRNGLVQDSLPRQKYQLKRLLGLKAEHYELKVLASVGGEGISQQLGEVLKTAEYIQRFASSCGKFVKENKLDGLDISWLDPTEQQKDRFTQLVQVVREELYKVRNNMVLTVSLGSQPHVVLKSYDVKEISKSVDYVNVLAFDFQRDVDNVTALGAPVFPQKDTVPYDSQDWVVSKYIELGLDASKSTLGIPMFGRTYKLCSKLENSVRSRSCGKGLPELISDQPGLIFYSEICRYIGQGNWTTTYDPLSRVPYTYNKDVWVSHENKQSIRFKTIYLRGKGLAGAMISDISQDDYRGACGDGKYPLLKIIAEEVGLIARAFGKDALLDDFRPSSFAVQAPPRKTILACILVACWGALWL